MTRNSARRCLRRLLAAPGLMLAAAAGHAAGCDWVGWDWLAQKCDYAGKAFSSGTYDLYLTGYSYHGRGTYTRERLRDFNEQAWGGGFGRTLSDDRGNTHDVYVMAFKDSHAKPQYLAGYGWQARWSLTDNVRAGLGLTAFLTLRSDFAHYLAPVPVVLPLASLQYRKVTLEASYVPRLSSHGGNGDVLFLFGKYSLD